MGGTKAVLALDFGGSSIKYGLVDAEGTIRAQGKVEAPRVSEEDFLSVVGSLIAGIREPLRGVAVSFCGRLDRKTGMIVSSGQFPFLEGKSVIDVIGRVYRGPVSVVNDGHAAGLAEMRMGSLRGYDHALVLVMGTGIGSALILDGQIYAGAHFRAGEYSLVRTDGTRNPESIWANNGGGVGLTKFVCAACGIEERIDGVEVFRRAEAGDTAVLAALEDYCEAFAVQIYNVQAAFDVDCFAIGGGISAQPLLIELLRKHVESVFADDARYYGAVQKPKVVACTYRNDANLIGAWVDFTERYGI